MSTVGASAFNAVQQFCKMGLGFGSDGHRHGLLPGSGVVLPAFFTSPFRLCPWLFLSPFSFLLCSLLCAPHRLKTEWVALSDSAEAQITTIANARPDLAIGVAFVDASGTPRWIGDDPTLQVHPPSVRGCWPTVHGIDRDEI